MQTADKVAEPGDDPAGWQLAAGDPASAEVLADLKFAWKACRSVKSNAILLAAGRASVGVGMGQVNRVDAARLAVARAGDRAAGAVAASDAYFPFPDGFEILAAGRRPGRGRARRIGPRRADHRGRAGGRRHALPHRSAAFLSLIYHRGGCRPAGRRAADRPAGRRCTMALLVSKVVSAPCTGVPRCQSRRQV